MGTVMLSAPQPLANRAWGMIWGVSTGGALYGACLGGVFAARTTAPAGIGTVLLFAFPHAAMGMISTGIMAASLIGITGIVRRASRFPWKGDLDGLVIGLVVGAGLLVLMLGAPDRPETLLVRAGLPGFLCACMGRFGQTLFEQRRVQLSSRNEYQGRREA